MSYLPNEISYDITHFLPNDDITDLMLMSRNFNAFVTPRLKKIDQEMTTLDQSIKSFMPETEPDRTGNEWISQLNLKRFEPIGSEAKKRMGEVLKNHHFLQCLWDSAKVMRPATLAFAGRDLFIRTLWNASSGMKIERFDRVKEMLSLGRFDDPTFLRILGALLARPKFRQEYNISDPHFKYAMLRIYRTLYFTNSDSYVDVLRIWSFYNSD